MAFRCVLVLGLFFVLGVAFQTCYAPTRPTAPLRGDAVSSSPDELFASTTMQSRSEGGPELGVTCCCEVHGGGICCNEQSYCGGWVRGCFCK